MINNQDLKWLNRGVTEVFPERQGTDDIGANIDSLLTKADRPLRVKLGIDPTSTEIHIGHSIPLRKLRAFQDNGHVAVLIFGDFTAQIGDPSGRSEVRVQLTSDAVKENVSQYIDQVKPILDFDTPGRLEIKYNSDWLSKLTLNDIMQLLATTTVSQMLAKEGFAERYDKNHPIFLHEFLYPLMQAYDSVAVKADIEIGGTDQKFNIAMGRDLQKFFGQKPQFGFLVPLLIGTDGNNKMSKSYNNFVGLREDSLSMYSKLEKIPDSIIDDYYELLTDFEASIIPGSPREKQKKLAWEVVRQYHGEDAANRAQGTAINLTSGVIDNQKTAIPAKVVAESLLPIGLVDLLYHVGLFKTKSECRRSIKGGAVRVDGKKITDTHFKFTAPDELFGKVLQSGKKKFVQVIKGS